MAQYNFTGVLDNISEPQLQFIHKIIVENGHEGSKVAFEDVGKAGDNYIANVKRIVIEGSNGNWQMIAKIAPTNEQMRMMTQPSILFRNEHIMYTELLPKLVQLQKVADIPESGYFRFAKCYGSQTEEPHEVILLEDLKPSGFIMLDRFESLSNDCVMKVLKNFAILHSLSFVLRHTEPKSFEYFKTNLADSFQLMAGNEMMKMNFQHIEDQTLSILEDPEHIKCFKNKVMDAITLSVKLSKADNYSKHTIIQQGDAWTNNILFRFEGDQVIDLVMVDYQQSKNTSPAYEILFMIFNCTDYELRKQNFYNWIDYYHTELDKYLADFNLKVNYVYPRDKLDVDLKRYGKLLFGICVIMANMLVRQSEDAEKMMQNILENKAAENMELIALKDDKDRLNFKTKVTGLLNSFTEFGLL